MKYAIALLFVFCLLMMLLIAIFLAGRAIYKKLIQMRAEWRVVEVDKSDLTEVWLVKGEIKAYVGSSYFATELYDYSDRLLELHMLAVDRANERNSMRKALH